MASLDSPAYGSLYFSDGPLESHMKIPFEQGFCIGPHCSPVFWNRNPGELELYGGPSPNCGPCQFHVCEELADIRELSPSIVVGGRLYCRM